MSTKFEGDRVVRNGKISASERRVIKLANELLEQGVSHAINENEVCLDMLNIMFFKDEKLKRDFLKLEKGTFDEVGLGKILGIPDFAIRDFANMKNSDTFVAVKVLELGLVFVIEEKSLKELWGWADKIEISQKEILVSEKIFLSDGKYLGFAKSQPLSEMR